MVKMNGADFKNFYNDEEYWGKKIHDDQVFTVNGKVDDDFDPEAVVASDIIEIEGGSVFNPNQGIESSNITLEDFYTAWKDDQLTSTVVVNVDIARLPDFIKFVEEFGAKIVV